MCNEPMSGDEMCYECGCFFEKQEFIVTDFYNYNARPPEILNQIRCELPVFTKATAVDVKNAMRKL